MSWQLTPVVPALPKLRQEDCWRLKVNLGHKVSDKPDYQKKKKRKEKKEKKKKARAGEMAALSKDPGTVPAPTWQLTKISNSSSRESNTFFWPLQVLHTCTDIQPNHPYT